MPSMGVLTAFVHPGEAQNGPETDLCQLLEIACPQPIDPAVTNMYDVCRPFTQQEHGKRGAHIPVFFHSCRQGGYFLMDTQNHIFRSNETPASHDLPGVSFGHNHPVPTGSLCLIQRRIRQFEDFFGCWIIPVRTRDPNADGHLSG